MDSFVLRIGGEAGWGIASAADIFAQVCLNLGYQVFSSKDYASQIKGGHNYHTVRVSQNVVRADIKAVNLLMALDKVTYEKHAGKVIKEGIILFDDKIKLEQNNEKTKKGSQKDKNNLILHLTKIEEKLKNKNIHNAVFLGAAIKSLGIEFNVLKECLDEYFAKKPELKELLLEAAQEGYDAVEKVTDLAKLGNNESNKNTAQNKKNFLTGNDAVTLGALKAGLTFHAQYPMTPVTGILHNLAQEAVTNKNLTIVQPEDEISAINMALGASYAGSRAMTATSGGGFALMVESFGLAGMAEVPLVVIEGQRPGPATGLPTKTEQGDLNFMLYAGVGAFPKVVLAPGDVEECYTETKRAFYLAEKYQLPVIVLIDKHLAESFKTFDLDKEEKTFQFAYEQRINMIDSTTKKINSADLNQDGLYKRYHKDNTQRTVPGTPNGIYTCAGDEHDDVGCITEDPTIRKTMMQRRMGKLELIRKELPSPELRGPENADLTVVSWGSNKGAIVEAIEKLNSEEKNQETKKINFLSIKNMLPFQSKEIKELLVQAKKLVLVENNYSAQLAGLIRKETGIEIKDKILRSDGKTFTVDDVYEELKKRSMNNN